jgi:hypothetical protein
VLCGYRALEAEEQALTDARQAGKRAVWNHREFEVEYAPTGSVLKIGEVHVDYLFDNADDAQAVESVADPRGFFEQLYLHVVFALAGVQPSTAQVRLLQSCNQPQAADPSRDLLLAGVQPSTAEVRLLQSCHTVAPIIGSIICGRSKPKISERSQVFFLQMIDPSGSITSAATVCNQSQAVNPSLTFGSPN